MKSQPVIKIAPSVLQWARETRFLTIRDVAERLKRDESEVRSWESGEQTPSFAQLEKLAYDIYKRPLAVFFLAQPPNETTITQDLRALPAHDVESLSPEFRLKTRRIKYLQVVLKEVFDDLNPVARPLHKAFRFSKDTSPNIAAGEVRRYLQFSHSEIRDLPTHDVALRFFKDKIEAQGIFIFTENLKEEASGFCLLDDQFPVICLNSQDISQKKIFTLFHELAHILFNAGGIFRDSLSERLIREKDEIEIFCNQFAAEFLIPTEFLLSERLVKNNKEKIWAEETIEKLSKDYKTSRESILRKLLSLELTTSDFYQQMKRKWDGQYRKSFLEKQKRQKAQPGGPDYHTTNISQLGKPYIKSVIRSLAGDRISEIEAADFLRIKVSKLTDYAQLIDK